MRGIYSSVTDIRRQVFTEVARMAYTKAAITAALEELPYKDFAGRGEQIPRQYLSGARHRGRAPAPVHGFAAAPIDEHAPLSTGIEEAAGEILRAALINIISATWEKSFFT